jgi:hypothetical protein
MWRSQTQKTVSLSSSEAEYYALSEEAKEFKFVVQVLELIGLQIKKKIAVHVDNVEVIFIAETPSATKHTRHIDARWYHFICEYIISYQDQRYEARTKGFYLQRESKFNQDKRL